MNNLVASCLSSWKQHYFFHASIPSLSSGDTVMALKPAPTHFTDVPSIYSVYRYFLQYHCYPLPLLISLVVPYMLPQPTLTSFTQFL